MGDFEHSRVDSIVDTLNPPSNIYEWFTSYHKHYCKFYLARSINSSLNIYNEFQPLSVDTLVNSTQ